MGSPWYMSPEQVKGEALLDPRSDLYSMGAVLYETLTGCKLFEGESAFAVMRAHVEQDAPSVSARVPGISSALDETVRKALAKDPANRFQSADEFRLALRQALLAQSAETQGQPIPAEALMPPVSRMPWYRRSRAAVLMALAPVGLVAGVCAVRFIPPSRPAISRTAPASPVAVTPVPAPAAMPDAPPPEGAPAPPIESDESNPVVCPRPAKRAGNRTIAPSRKTQANNGLRVGGPDIQPAQPCALPLRPATPPPAFSARTAPKLDPPAAPQPAEKQVEAPASAEESPEPRDAAQSEPQKNGNRLVRALGKMNPFRKRSAGEPVKPQAAKDEKPNH
jgi:eukaryotic-like serine/threonine-protein kinase